MFSTSSSSSSFRVPGGLEVTDHFFRVPLAHPRLDFNGIETRKAPASKKESEIEIFVREIVAIANCEDKKRASLKTALYLQGGPGFECARIQDDGGWIGHLAKEKNMV